MTARPAAETGQVGRRAPGGQIGKPAATPKREVIDDSYDYALELDFADLAAQDVYQAHDTHTAFIDACKPMWRAVRVYDFEWIK